MLVSFQYFSIYFVTLHITKKIPCGTAPQGVIEMIWAGHTGKGDQGKSQCASDLLSQTRCPYRLSTSSLPVWLCVTLILIYKYAVPLVLSLHLMSAYFIIRCVL